MKVLQIRYQGERQITLDLHPQLTLVRGLTGAERQGLTAALAGLPKGAADGLEGQIEGQGVIMDLTPTSLQMLGQSSDVDIVVRAADLPGHDADASNGAERLRAAKERCDRQTTELDRAMVTAKAAQRRQDSLTKDLEKLRSRSSAAADNVVRAASELARLRSDHENATSEVARFEQALRDAKARHEGTLGGKDAARRAVEAAHIRRAQAAEAVQRAATAVEEAGSASRADEVPVEVARIRLEERVSAAERAATAVERAAARLDEARSRQVESIAAMPEESAPSGDPSADSGADVDAHAHDDADAHASAPAGSPVGSTKVPDDEGEESIVDRINTLERRRAEVNQLLVAVAGTDEDASHVREALDAARSAPDRISTGPSRDRALGLAARWRDLELAITEHEKAKAASMQVEGEEPIDLASARSRLAKALRTHADAVAAMDTPDVSDGDIEALEKAHTAVLDAQERTDSRFGGGKAKRRLEEARAEERSILDRLGYSTFADYMMSASNRYSGSGDKAVVETAERALTAAKRAFAQEWSKVHPGEPVPGVAPAEPDRGRVEDVWQVAGRKVDPKESSEVEEVDEDAAVLERRRDDLLREATAVLGREPGDDVAAELEAVKEPPVKVDPRITKLAEVLAAVGLAVAGESLDRNTLIEYADAWLTEQQMSTWRRTELEAELIQVDAGLVKLWDARAAQRRAARDAAAASSSAEFESGSVVVEVDRSRGLFGDPRPQGSSGEDQGSGTDAGSGDDEEAPPGGYPYMASPSTSRGLPHDLDPDAAQPQGGRNASVADGTPAGAPVVQPAIASAEHSWLEQALHEAQDELARCRAEVEDATDALEAAERRVALAGDVEALLAERQAELEVRRAEELEAIAALTAAEAALAGFDDGPEVSATAQEVAQADAAVRTAREQREAAAAALAAAERSTPGSDDEIADQVAAAEQQASEAAEALSQALAAVEAAKVALEAADADRQTLRAAEAARKEAAATQMADRETLLEDIEWYLLSRLAAQRAVSEAGSVPLILDDTFAELQAEEGAWLLARLERMAAAVQIVVLSDSPEMAAWAGALDGDRVAVIRADAPSAA